jgi:glutathione synthase/RimK-type ligase-like ATP-grasp enzyme
MIVLWGLLEDGTMKTVHDRLKEIHADVLFLNHAEIDKTEIQFESEPIPQYKINYQGKNYDLDDCTASYLRPYNFRDYPQFSQAENSSSIIKCADIFHHIIHSWAEHSSAIIINRPSAEATNHSKLFQSIQISASGFIVPDSLVSNDHDEIMEFHSRHRSIIYKSMSSVRSIVKEFSLNDLKGRKNMGPVFFQQRIIGTNVRVHVVGEKVFACRIESEGIDYRYAQSELVPCNIQDDITEKCIQLTKNLGLVIAGLDLIITPQRDWYCLEANPSPGFSYFDIAEGRPIARAVAELLYI